MLARGVFGMSTDILRPSLADRPQHDVSGAPVEVSIDWDAPGRYVGPPVPKLVAAATTASASGAGALPVRRYTLRRGGPTPSPPAGAVPSSASGTTSPTKRGTVPAYGVGLVSQDELRLLLLSASTSRRSRTPRSPTPPSSPTGTGELPSLSSLPGPSSVRSSVSEHIVLASPRHAHGYSANLSRAVAHTMTTTVLPPGIASAVHRETTPLDMFADATLVSPPSGVISFGSSATSSRVPSPIAYHPHTLTAAAAARLARQQGRDGTVTPNNTSDEESSDDEGAGDAHRQRQTLSPRAKRVQTEWVLVTEPDTLSAVDRIQRALLVDNPVARWMVTAEPLLSNHDQFCDDMHQLVEGYIRHIRAAGADTQQIGMLFGAAASVHDSAQYVRRVFREAVESRTDAASIVEQASKALVLLATVLESHVRALPGCIQHLSDTRSWDEAFEEQIAGPSRTLRPVNVLVRRPFEYVPLLESLLRSFAAVPADAQLAALLRDGAHSLHLWAPRADELPAAVQ